jgi:hypothetical protein
MVSNIPKNKAENGIIGRWEFSAAGKGRGLQEKNRELRLGSGLLKHGETFYNAEFNNAEDFFLITSCS